MTREEAINILKEIIDESWIFSDIEKAPTIDACEMAISALSENKGEPETGHWSRKRKVDAYDIAGVKTWGIKCQCDRCTFTTIVVEDFGYYKYCPNCGAKMKGGEE